MLISQSSFLSKNGIDSIGDNVCFNACSTSSIPTIKAIQGSYYLVHNRPMNTTSLHLQDRHPMSNAVVFPMNHVQVNSERLGNIPLPHQMQSLLKLSVPHVNL